MQREREEGAKVSRRAEGGGSQKVGGYDKKAGLLYLKE